MQMDSLKSTPPAQVEGIHQELRFLRLPDVMRMTARGRTTTLSGVREGTFPGSSLVAVPVTLLRNRTEGG